MNECHPEGYIPWIYDAVTENTPLATTGGHTWPAAKRLAEYLEHEQTRLGLGCRPLNAAELNLSVPPSSGVQRSGGSGRDHEVEEEEGEEEEGGLSILELGSGAGWLGVTLARALAAAAAMTAAAGGAGGGGGRSAASDKGGQEPALSSSSSQQVEDDQVGGRQRKPRRQACIVLTEKEDGVEWLQHNVSLNSQGRPGASTISVLPCDWSDYLHDDDSTPTPTTTLSHGTNGPTTLPDPIPSTPAISSPPSAASTSAGLLSKQSGGSGRRIGRLAPNSRPWDLILGSDLIYLEGGCIALPRVLRALVTPGHTRVLYCHTKHRFDYLDVRLAEELEKCGLAMEEVWEEGRQRPPPSPPPLTELFPEMRIAVYSIAPVASLYTKPGHESK